MHLQPVTLRRVVRLSLQSNNASQT